MDEAKRSVLRFHRVCRVVAVTVLLVIAGCSATPSRAAEPADSPTAFDQVTIGALNVENFFDEHNDPYTRDEGTDPKTEGEMAAMAKLIRRMDADFLGIVEVETQGLVWSFKNRYLPRMGYDDIYVGHRDYGRGINNGAISRVPIQTVYDYHFRELRLPGEQRYWRFARSVLAFDIEPRPGVTMRIFVVHFKSKRDSPDDPDSAKWRLSEAKEVRRIVDKQLADDPDALVAVVGDFNDTPDSEPIRALLGPNERGKRSLIDAHAGLPDDQRVTYLREPYRSTIDYIMVSPAMAKLLQPGSARVYNDDAVLEATDHAGLSATFTVPPPAE